MNSSSWGKRVNFDVSSLPKQRGQTMKCADESRHSIVKIGNSLKAGEETCEPIYNIWMQDILGKNSRTMNKKTRKYARG